MGKNRCLRCNRELKDPNARYGWRCAEILGVDEALNYAGDGAWEAYQDGIRAAGAYLKENSIDKSSINLAKFYEAMIKRSLAASMDDFELIRAAAQEMYEALGLSGYGKKGKTYTLGEYIEARDNLDYEQGMYATGGYLSDEFHPVVADIQHSLSQMGATDKFGNPIRIDGKFGPKTQWAVDKLLNKGEEKPVLEKIFDAFADNLKLVAEGLWFFDSDKNYEHNKEIDFENRTELQKAQNGNLMRLTSPDEEGYITDQTLLDDLRFGVKTSNENGCGWIAAYNALKLLGETPDAAELIRDMEKGAIAHGRWGTWPWPISNYFRNLGYEVTDTIVFYLTTTQEEKIIAQAAEADVNIYVYLRPGTGGGHYVAFSPALGSGEEEGGPAQYKFYNTGTQGWQSFPNPAWKEGDDEREKDIWFHDGADDVRTLKEVMDADKKIFRWLISIKKKEE